MDGVGDLRSSLITSESSATATAVSSTLGLGLLSLGRLRFTFELSVVFLPFAIGLLVVKCGSIGGAVVPALELGSVNISVFVALGTGFISILRSCLLLLGIGSIFIPLISFLVLVPGSIFISLFLLL